MASSTATTWPAVTTWPTSTRISSTRARHRCRHRSAGKLRSRVDREPGPHQVDGQRPWPSAGEVEAGRLRGPSTPVKRGPPTVELDRSMPSEPPAGGRWPAGRGRSDPSGASSPVPKPDPRSSRPDGCVRRRSMARSPSGPARPVAGGADRPGTRSGSWSAPRSRPGWLPGATGRPPRGHQRADRPGVDVGVGRSTRHLGPDPFDEVGGGVAGQEGRMAEHPRRGSRGW